MATFRTLLVSGALLLPACDRTASDESSAGAPETVSSASEEPSPRFRNVTAAVEYAGDDACTPCHEEAAAAYRTHGMARSFHPWTPEARIETPTEEPLRHAPTGFHYAVIEVDGALYQEEFLPGPDGRRLHELRRRIDYVMGSGNIARTYFTEENGRLFQLPLTWYRTEGWDFSPGYEIENPRFDRLLPDGCLACHGGHPESLPFLEGKYAELRPGIGCERCHGPGALHVRQRTAEAGAGERAAAVPADSGYDDTIVDPRSLALARRLDVCEQCHVHTPVTVLREGREAFDYLPSQPLADHAAFFKTTGSIDIVSHADRLRQSACFVATREGERPLECATCHDPHAPPPAAEARSAPCRSCHAAADLEERLDSSPALADHAGDADCVGCHMPSVKERSVPHGTFTDHWIRVVRRPSSPEAADRSEHGDEPLEPYFERDRSGPDAGIYRAMGEIVYATRTTDPRLLREAAEVLERELRADTTHADAQFLLGVAYRQLGRGEAAIRALERSLRVEREHPQRLHALARAYEGTGGDPDTIGRIYERALDLQPALAWIRADYADFLEAHGRHAEAAEEFRAALAERPSLAVAAFELGALLTGRGRLDEAAEAFGRAVRLDPTLAEGLAPLLQMRTHGRTVTGLRVVGSLLPTLPVRDRGPGAVRATLDAGADRPGVRFVGVPPGATIRILEPDGTPVRALPPGDAPPRRDASLARVWDLMTEAGNPIAGGLYRIEVRVPDASDRPVPRQRFFLGVVRTGGS